MKFKFNDKPPKAFWPVFVECSDAVMAELLSIAYRVKSRPTIDQYARIIETGRQKSEKTHVYDFFSGAKMSLAEGGGFNVFGYHYSWQDTLDALEELNTLHALRKARYHFNRSRGLQRPEHFKPGDPVLKIQVVYTPRC